jgi:hypothetical protein
VCFGETWNHVTLLEMNTADVIVSSQQLPPPVETHRFQKAESWKLYGTYLRVLSLIPEERTVAGLGFQ